MQRVLIFSLICVVALCAGVYLSFPHPEFSIGTFSLYEPPRVEEEIIEKTKIRFTGDIMLARNVENLMNLYGASYPVSELMPHPRDAYLVGNFEGSIPVEHVHTESMTFSFSVKPEHLQGLRDYGFTHFGLANNHAFDFGVDDFLNTENVLQNTSFVPFGTPGELSSSTSMTVIDLGTTTVAVVGVYAVNGVPPLADVVSVFKHAENISDKQVAYVHWGEEYKGVHNASQERLAHAFIDAGADVVVGHHPHVLQDIELYKDVPIFYSLGNFIFDQYFTDEVQMGLLLEMSFDEMLTIDLFPVTSIGSRSVTRLPAAYERNELLQDLAKKSSEELQEMIQNGSIKLAF